MKKNSEVMVDYDLGYDLLYLRKDLNKKVKGSFAMDNFVFDLSDSGSIIGVQIDNASSQIGVSPQVLNNIKSAIFSVLTTPQAIGVRYGIVSGQFHSNNEFRLTREQLAVSC